MSTSSPFVAFLSDATGTFDYPDVGFGAIPAKEVYRVSLGILGVSTAHVMTVDQFLELAQSARPAERANQSNLGNL